MGKGAGGNPVAIDAEGHAIRKIIGRPLDQANSGAISSPHGVDVGSFRDAVGEMRSAVQMMPSNFDVAATVKKESNTGSRAALD